ncbi:sigma-70 family RNA polymerase sigma factor [Streptomyces sp. NPDC048604]|uniref:sigma-70 family RNA polymerase sigma factor n=1 Tax=Streptomyces sp. NPDC048604 TaxID=3365578 RepID=UPI0037242FDF
MFGDALASPDTRRYAWEILRATVHAKADHRDHRPQLTGAAFDTVALREQPSPEGEMAQLAETLELFAAISRLPDAQLDVMVLRRLCGFTAEKVSDLLGIPLAAVRSNERHAERFLEDTIASQAPRTASICTTSRSERHTPPAGGTQTNEDKPPTRHMWWTTVHSNDAPVVLCYEDKAPTATIVRVLRNLAQGDGRPRSAVVTELMEYMPTAVAVGYLRQPDSELPLPGPAFSRKIQGLLETTADRPDRPSDRTVPRRDTGHRALKSREINEAAAH